MVVRLYGKNNIYCAELCMVLTEGGEWKYRLLHRGGVPYKDYVSQENALRAFKRMYGNGN